MTNQTYAVFYPKAPLQGTAAGNTSANSRTTLRTGSSPTRGTFRRADPSQNRQNQTNPNNPSEFSMHPSLNIGAHPHFAGTLYRVTSSCRTSQTLPYQLDRNNKRQLGVAVHPRISVGADREPSPDKTSRGAPDVGLGSSTGGHRGGETGPKRSSANGGCCAQSVCQQRVYCAEEGWLTAAGGQPQTTEYLHAESTLQNGRDPGCKGTTEERRLDGVHRSEGRLPIDPSGNGSSEVPTFQMERSSLRVPMPSIWAQQCSPHIHEGAKASDGSPETKRDEINRFHRRPSLDGPVPTGVAQAYSGGHSVPPDAGIPDKLGEVSDHPLPGDTLSWVPDQLGYDDALPSQGKDTSHNRRLQDSFISRDSVSENTCQDNRQDDGSISGHSNGSIALQKVAGCKEQSVQAHPVIRIHSQSEHGGQRRVAMVDRQDGEMERKECASTVTRPGNRNGRLPSWMGRINGRCNDRGSVVGDGENTAYQSAGIERRCLCCESFHQREEQHPRTVEDGQYNSSGLPQSYGRYEVPKLSTLCIAVVAVVFGARNHHFCRASARGEERKSRYGVTDSALIDGVEVASSAMSVDDAMHGSMSSRPICDTSEQPVKALHQLAPRSVRDCYGRVSGFMEVPERLCFPTILSGGEVP